MAKNKLNDKYVDALSSRFETRRLGALRKLAEKDRETTADASFNLMIHSACSFSPYTPSLAAFMAFKFGIRLAGLMDNYTLAGADEFIKACRILGVSYSVGVELRADLPFTDAKVGNVALFGIAARGFKPMQRELKAFRETQKGNVSATIKAVNKYFKELGVSLSEGEVMKLIPKAAEPVYLSKYVFLALAEKAFKLFGRDGTMKMLLERGFELSETEKALIMDEGNLYCVYDLANYLFECRDRFLASKSYHLPDEIIALGHKYGAVCAFEYSLRYKLCDTAENRALLSRLSREVKSAGFDGVCFDPNKLDGGLRETFLDELEKNELLALPLYSVEFPRQEFLNSFPDERTAAVMTEAAFTVVGSEMCENLTGEGFVASNLKVDGFHEKVALFSKIGRGE